MKTKLFLLLTAITLTFQACSSDDDNNDPMVEACDTPINLSISEITADSAILNWESPNDNQYVKVEYALAGFSPGTGTVVMTSENTLPIDNLIPGTSYDFYVQALCATNAMNPISVSPTSGLANFTTIEISPYAGTWSGTYDGDDTGTWTLEISANGNFVSAYTFSIPFNSGADAISGAVTADGLGTASFPNGTAVELQITGENASGTWTNGPISGTLTGSRE